VTHSNTKLKSGIADYASLYLEGLNIFKSANTNVTAFLPIFLLIFLNNNFNSVTPHWFCFCSV